MKYTLQMNALSSLTIAIEKFKRIYYYNGTVQDSIYDENMKMCVIFLENSVELLLKSILVINDTLSIYVEPNSRKVREALEKVDENNKLEDILIHSGDFKTITYTEAVDKVCADVCKSNKVKSILLKLGYIRNAITHFGIIGNDDEYIISFINVFDVIYNYLFPEIVKIKEISDYLTSDGFFVKTLHGVKPLLDDNNVYNNIIDFLDEIMEERGNWCYRTRVKNPDFKIGNFISLFCDLINTDNFKKMFSYYGAYMHCESLSLDMNKYYIEIGDKKGIYDGLFAVYSPYYNSSSFIGESGHIYFRIEHSNNTILIYKKFIDLPDCSDPEFEDYEWKEHIDKGFCTPYKLTKRNIKLAFKNIIHTMTSNDE